MPHNRHPFSDELLKAAEDVLTGRLNREALAQRKELSPIDYRNILAYVGVALILATGYQIDTKHRMLKPLGEILQILTYKGTQEASECSIDSYVTGSRLQAAAAKLGLHVPGARSGSRLLILSPPTELEELVARHKENPAIRKFLEDAGVSEAFLLAAKGVAETFENQYGRMGLEQLLEQVRTALGK